MPIDLGRLTEALEAFPPSSQIAVEPRHASWFTDAFRLLLVDHCAALCLADRRGPITPQWRTADWTYVRFHGGRATPRPCYGKHALETWASRLVHNMGRHAEGYAYFNNDHQGCALRDAASFGRRLANLDVDVGRIPDLGEEVIHGA